MRVVSHRKIRDFGIIHPNAQMPLERWYEIASRASWENISDMKLDFPSVDYVGNQHYVFNIGGNNFRLIVVVKFTIGYIFVRFIGTHAQYDKINAQTI